jgi:hypothetical protein
MGHPPATSRFFSKSYASQWEDVFVWKTFEGANASGLDWKLDQFRLFQYFLSQHFLC